MDESHVDKIDYIIRPTDINFIDSICDFSCEVLIREIKFFGSYYIIVCFSEKYQQMIFVQANRVQNLSINQKILIFPSSIDKIKIIKK